MVLCLNSVQFRRTNFSKKKYLKGQSRSKNLAAVNGRLKDEKQKSEKASDNRNGVVEWFLRSFFRNRTMMVKRFPMHPNMLQIIAAQAAMLEMFLSNIGSVPSL